MTAEHRHPEPPSYYLKVGDHWVPVMPEPITERRHAEPCSECRGRGIVQTTPNVWRRCSCGTPPGSHRKES